MSRTVDERVVSMQFDNKQFESNVQTSLNTMDKLKESLKFTGATKGLENIDDASKKVNMLHLGSAVEQIGVKFNALQVMATTALANITNSAVNAGKKLVSAFTIDPVKTGMQEYETQINAVQTILANTESKGTTLNDVTAALDELNTYADKTIYNFTEMTRNIGTFTAAGVDLDTSTTAIQGIANLAAVSGSTSQQASTAMYQLSQALSSGTVKLMDWNSVVNAGMGGQVFQDALKETARNAGVNIDALIEKYGSFRETLSTGWITSDILTETLSHFTMVVEGAEEGTEEYTKKWNELKASLKEQGYTDEQAENILKMSRTATDAATKVKTFTQLLDTLKESAQSGWTQTWEILIGDFEEAKNLWTNVSNVIGEMIGKSAEARNSMLQGWKDLGGRQMVIDSISNAFTGLMNILRPIGEAFREIFPAVTSKQLLTATERIKDLTERFKAFTENSKNIEKIKSAFKGFFSIINIVWIAVKEVAAGVLTLASNLGDLIKGVLNVSGSFGDWVSNLRDTVVETGVFKTIIGGLVSGIQKVIDVLKVVIGFLKEKIAAPGFQGFLSLMNGIWKVISWIGEKIVAVGKAIGGALGDAFKGGQIDNLIDIFNSGVIAAILLKLKSVIGGISEISSSFGDILGGVTDYLKAMQQEVQAKTLIKIATAIAILVASLLVLSMINPDRLYDAVSTITMLFGELLGSMAIFNKIGAGGKGVLKSTVVMIAMATSILILASALKIISTIEPDDMAIALVGIASVMTLFISAIKILQSGDPDRVTKGAGQMVLMAISLAIVAGALKIVASMSWQELAIGLTGITVALGVLVGAVKILEQGKFKASGAGQMLLMAVSLTILAGALKIVASMSWQELAIGLTGIVVALGVLVGAIKILEQGEFKASGTGQILIMAVSLTILAAALKTLSGLGWEGIAIGLTGLIVTLGVLVGAVKILEHGGNIAAGAGQMLLMAVSLTILAGSLAILASLGWSGLLIGLTGIAATFLILGVAAAVLGPLVPVILGLSGAMALLGVGVLALGVGLVFAATGLTALAAAFSASGTIIVSGVTAILVGIINLIPALIVAIGQGIIGICNVIAGAAGSICAAIAAIIVAVANALIIAAPPLVEAIFVVLDVILKKLVEYTPIIVDAAVKLIVALLEGLATGLPKIVESAVTLIEKFLIALGEQIPRIVDAGFKMIISFIEGITKAINENTPVLVEKMRELIKALINAAVLVLTGGIVNLKEMGSKIMDSGFIQGIKSKISDMKNAVSDFIGKAKDKITEKINDFKSAGKDIINGFIKGIKEKISAVGNAAAEIGKKALNSIKSFLGIESPSKEFAKIGRYSDEGLIAGLKAYSGKVANAAGAVGGSALDTMKKSISGMANLFGSDFDSQPTIRPVLDLSAVTAGANSINGMFDMTPSVGVMSTIGAISSAMNGRQNGVNDDVITAIKDLGVKIGSASGDTYQINGVTYDDGSNIVSAIEAIVREARIERRM